MVKALSSHQCGPGSNPGVDAIRGLSLLLVLSFAPRGISPGTPVFPSPQNPASKFQFDQESGTRRTTLWMCYLQIIIYFFISLFLYFFLSFFIYFIHTVNIEKISICLNKGRGESVGKDHVSIVCARKYEMVRMT